jgi:hypothetical protein
VAQKRYLRLVRAKIAVLVFISIATSLAWDRVPGTRTVAATIVAVFLIIATSASFLMDLRKFDHNWFVCRAIAESVKTETWKFVTKADPYTALAEDEGHFLNRVRELLKRQRPVPLELSEQCVASGQITEIMREIRNKSLPDRRTFYAENRILDQLNWYAKKARWNQSRELLWFFIGWMLQVVTVIGAVIMIAFGDFPFNPVGVLTTAAVGALSWYHARNYRELSQSYGLVAQELGILRDQIDSARTDARLAEIVMDVERTISREHTIWLAGRLGTSEI